MMIRDVPALLEGLSARDVTVWGEAPRKRPHTNPSGLKTVVGTWRDNFAPAFQALGDVMYRIQWACPRRTQIRQGCHLARLLL